jgi:hypothetical protein
LTKIFFFFKIVNKFIRIFLEYLIKLKIIFLKYLKLIIIILILEINIINLFYYEKLNYFFFPPIKAVIMSELGMHLESIETIKKALDSMEKY